VAGTTTLATTLPAVSLRADDLIIITLVAIIVFICYINTAAINANIKFF
jgi:hypothetical protein